MEVQTLWNIAQSDVTKWSILVQTSSSNDEIQISNRLNPFSMAEIEISYAILVSIKIVQQCSIEISGPQQQQQQH